MPKTQLWFPVIGLSNAYTSGYNQGSMIWGDCTGGMQKDVQNSLCAGHLFPRALVFFQHE